MFIFKWRYRVCLLRYWLNLFASLRGLPSKDPRAKSSCSALRFMAALSLSYHLCWGCHRRHPYLLISLLGKSLHRDVDGFETDSNSNKLVQANLRSLKSHLSPFLPLLLATNPLRRKEEKDSRGCEFAHRPHPIGTTHGTRPQHSPRSAARTRRPPRGPCPSRRPTSVCVRVPACYRIFKVLNATTAQSSPKM